MKIKAKRVANSIRVELSKIIANETQNEIIKNITITDVEVTNDLSFAKIFYTFMGEYSKEEISNELDKTNSFLRKTLANTIEVRHTPELIFIFDESITYGQRIEELIKEIKDENK